MSMVRAAVIFDDRPELPIFANSALSERPVAVHPPRLMAATLTAPSKYRTAPDPNLTGMPPGVPYIIGNEAAERFSFYGMRSILVVFMTKYLLDSSGASSPMSDAEAMERYHWFVSAVYFFPLVFAPISDILLGKYRTIMTLSI